MQTGSAEDLRAALSTLLAPVDREALTDELAAYLHENFRMAMARFVPAGHGRWPADHVPGAEGHISPDDDHVSLIERVVPLAQGWLASQFR